MYTKYVKRILDFSFALLLIILCSPIMFIIALAIYFEGEGTIFFKQDRIGKKGKAFRMYKFRTMKWDNKLEKAYVTKLGGFLRRTSLDEIPQLFNIFKGDMSFIGPRPWIAEYLLYFTPNQKKRCNVNPGISGWAQVNGRNGLNIFEKIKYDIWYVENVSFVTDLRIFFMTVKTVLFKKDAELPYTGIKDEMTMLRENYDIYIKLQTQ